MIPIIHWSANAPIKRSKLNEVSAFPAFESEKAIPTAGWVSDKKTELTAKKAQWYAPALGPR